jgi:predicted neutral ceramidase superfamily lipid hydrolase
MIEDEHGDHSLDYQYGLMLAALIVVKRFVTRTVRTHLLFKMNLMGNKASDALKFILFKKQFRISFSSNIQMTSSELMNVIERDPGVIWRFVWEMSDLVFVPLDFVYSLLMLVYALGYSTLTGVIMYAVVYCVNWQKDKFNRASDESIRVLEVEKHSKL